MSRQNAQRIVVISQHFWPESGATAQLIADLADGLSSLGWQVVVCTNAIGQEQMTGIRVARLGRTTDSKQRCSCRIIGKTMTAVVFFVRALVWSIREVRSSDCLLVVSNPPFIGLLGQCLKLTKKASFTFLLQDIFPESAVLSGLLPRNSIRARFWHVLTQKTCISADHVVVLNSSMQKRIKKEFGEGVKTTVIHNWAVETGLAKASTPDHQAFGYGNPEYFTIQYSGNFGRLHDIETLLGAALLLRDEQIRFVFIGGGHKQQLIERFISENDLSNIIMLPYQSRERLRQSLGACDLSAICLVAGAEDIVAPSKLYGILASGKPVLLVAEKGCELAELVVDSGCGLVVRPGDVTGLADKIRSISIDIDLVEKMGRRSRDLYAHRFGLKRSLVLYDQVFRKCLSR